MKIVAASGGFLPGSCTQIRPGPIIELCLDLAGRPSQAKICVITTATGDQRSKAYEFHEAFQERPERLTTLALMPRPSVEDIREHLLAQDVIWVDGGSVAGLLALWRLHGLDVILRDAWKAGVVLGGVSAGSICWHTGGPTDSFGRTLQAITNGLALLPYGNGVHYDGEDQRRPLLHQMVADGSVPSAYATDNGVALVYEGTSLVEAVADRPGVNAYEVHREADGTVTEKVITPRLLDGAAKAKD